MPYRPKDILKSPYVLEFAGLDDKSSYHESDLEAGALNKLQDLLPVHPTVLGNTIITLPGAMNQKNLSQR